MYKVKKGIDTMYYLRDEACAPIDLTEEEYSWMAEQSRAKRTADLKKAMTHTRIRLELRSCDRL